MPPTEQGLAQFIKEALYGLDERLRKVETSVAVMQNRLDTIKSDSCAKHDISINELYTSRNAASTDITLVKQRLESAGTALDAHIEGHASAIADIEKAEAELQAVRTDLTTIKNRHEAEDRKTTTYIAPIITAVIATAFSSVLAWFAAQYAAQAIVQQATQAAPAHSASK